MVYSLGLILYPGVNYKTERRVYNRIYKFIA